MTRKKKILFSLSLPLLLGTVILLSISHTCQPFEPELFLELTTDAVASLPGGEYKLTGSIVSFSEEEITQHGFCWSETTEPTANGANTKLGKRDSKGSFTSTISNLSSSKKYYMRAYVITNAGTDYGNEKSFTTPALSLATLTTTAISNKTINSAQSGGNITDNGGASVTARGVCWSTSPSPTITNQHTSNGSGTGSFSSSITGLSPETIYYVRAYASNSVGTVYGNERFFSTIGGTDCLPISVDNTIATNITGCFGDYTGSIQVVASGGFGAPWQYSIDNGLSYSTVAYFANLPAGDYQVVVMDKEGCSQVGPLITLIQPDILEVQVVAVEDITVDHDGSIVVVAQGGTSPYIFWLQPDGPPQAYGTFVFLPGESGEYVVAVNDFNDCGPVLTDSLVIEETVTDIDGNVYQTVQIGNQIWMAENLKTTRYADGTPMQLVESGTDWHNGTTPRAYCWYNNNASIGNIYGALYHWNTAMNGADSSDVNPSGVQGACPDGWHLPSEAEWDELEIYLGTNVGGKLKEAGTTHWRSPNEGANNESEFTALPGGYRLSNFDRLGEWAYFWTATSNSPGNYGATRILEYNDTELGRGDYYDFDGFSVRCVKD